MNGSLPGQKLPVRILIAEDNPYDVVLLQEALCACDWSPNFQVVQDGARLLECLANSAGTPNFDLLIVDANLPRKSTRDVLGVMRASKVSVGAPVVVISSVLAPAQINEFLALGVDLVLTKPFELAGYAHLATKVASLVSSLKGESESNPQ